MAEIDRRVEPGLRGNASPALSRGNENVARESAPNVLTTVDLALSGGGTRAALLSLGALLAVSHAVDAGVVKVGKVRAISGSALVVLEVALRLDGKIGEGKEIGLTDSILQSAERTCRHGYKYPILRTSLQGAAFGGIMAVLLGVLAGVTFTWRFPVTMAVLAAGSLTLASRSAPPSLHRGDVPWMVGRAKKHPEIKLHESCWQGIEHESMRGWAVGVGVLRLRDVRYEKLNEPDFTRGLSHGNLIAAVAAFPGAFRPVPSKSDRLVDGGVYDNLAVTDFVYDARKRACPPDAETFQEAARLIAVDASQAPSAVETSSRRRHWLTTTVTRIVAATAVGIYLAPLFGLSMSGEESHTQLPPPGGNGFYAGIVIGLVGILVVAAVLAWMAHNAGATISGIISDTRSSVHLWQHNHDFVNHRLREDVKATHPGMTWLTLPPCESKIPTTLNRLDNTEAHRLLRHGYQQACGALRIEESPDHVQSLDSFARKPDNKSRRIVRSASTLRTNDPTI